VREPPVAAAFRLKPTRATPRRVNLCEVGEAVAGLASREAVLRLDDPPS
jgi:hypothetical protein